MIVEYCLDVDIGIEWILKTPDYFNLLNIGDKSNHRHFYLPITDVSDKFLVWCTSINCEIWYSEIFYNPPYKNLFIHSDSLKPSDSCKLNWVYDQDQTYMRWHKVKNGAELKFRKNNIGGEYFSCDSDDDYVLQHQHRISTPTLINASEPHDVINPTGSPRWCVSVVLRENGTDWRIGYSRLREILASCIKTPSTII